MIKGMNYVLMMGGPGSGKSTLGKLLSSKLNMFYISKGDTSRTKDRHAYQLSRPDEFQRVDSIFHQNVNQSKTQVVVELIYQQIYDLEVSQLNSKVKKQFLVEGVPKSKQMLQIWHSRMDPQIQLKYCIHLQCSEELMMRRIIKRSEEQTRLTDSLQDYQAFRIQRYKKDIEYVKSYYEQKGKLVNVDGSGDPNTVLKRIMTQLRLRNLTGT